jgi:hypothetical protein
MASTTKISNAMAILAVDAMCNSNTGLNSGKMRIYTGGMPAGGPDVAATGTLLAELTLNAAAFAAATDGTGKATAQSGAITSDTSAAAAGTAGWFRIWNTAVSTAYIDGNVGTVDEALVLDNVSIALNDTVAVSDWDFELSEQ